MVGRRFEVLGRVQGVGFRAYVLGLADELGLTGEVWNRRDGAVEVVAFAPNTERLKSLEAMLREGPGRVDKVVSCDAEAVETPTGFRASFSR